MIPNSNSVSLNTCNNQASNAQLEVQGVAGQVTQQALVSLSAHQQKRLLRVYQTTSFYLPKIVTTGRIK
jgi:hypothetical protein